MRRSRARAQGTRTDGFAPLDRPMGLRDRVYAMVREHLRHGAIAPEVRIQELTLANQLGVSRTPVREALALLAKEGLVRPARRGFVVPTLADSDIAAIYELRGLLEPHGVSRAAARATAAGLRRLRAALADSRKADVAGDAAAFIRANAAFRDAWLAMVDNAYLVRAVSLYDDHVNHLRIVSLRDAKVRAIVLQGLDRITARIAVRDEPGAAAAMRRHLGNAEAVLRAKMRDAR